MKRLKELETENGRLRRAVTDLTLDKLILAEPAKVNSSWANIDVQSAIILGPGRSGFAEPDPGSAAVAIDQLHTR
jgi:hypothetical protein